ncbi:CAC1S protein, partial [Turnix velox]|nr:CAC1S protein [Turnix velox]
SVMGTASSSGHLQGDSGVPSRSSSTPAITFLIQEALISGGLEALARDPAFLAVTRDEMVASSQLQVDEVEKAALELLKGRETLQARRTSAASPASSPGLSTAHSEKTMATTHL